MKLRTLLPLVFLIGCVGSQEVQSVKSPLNATTSLDVVERVFANAGYPPVSEDNIENGREVVRSEWRDYPPGHEASGPFQRRPVAVITPQKDGSTIALRFDVAKCTHDGSAPRCNPVDMLFASDKKELDAIRTNLETQLTAVKNAAVVTTTGSAPLATPSSSSTPPSPSTPASAPVTPSAPVAPASK